MKHYYKIGVKILTNTYPHGRFPLLLGYLKLVIKAFLSHRKGRKDDQVGSSAFTEKVLGLTIHFTCYAELINLFEEIFIEQAYAFKSAQADPIIIDCGSNIGISVLYFNKIYPLSKILAFEPSRTAYELLLKNISDNKLSGVTPLNFALSEKEGEAVLYKSNHADSLTLSLQNTPGRTVKEIITSTLISKYINDKIDFIKIDVEGHETAIMKDLIRSQKIEMVNQMVIEFHPEIAQVPIEKFVDTIEQNNFQCDCEKDQLHPGATELLIHCIRNHNQA